MIVWILHGSILLFIQYPSPMPDDPLPPPNPPRCMDCAWAPTHTGMLNADVFNNAQADNLPCLYRGLLKPHGKRWKANECTTCTCSNATTTCQIDTCKVPKCPNPKQVPGECCLRCPIGESGLTSTIPAWVARNLHHPAEWTLHSWTFHQSLINHSAFLGEPSYLSIPWTFISLHLLSPSCRVVFGRQKCYWWISHQLLYHHPAFLCDPSFPSFLKLLHLIYSYFIIFLQNICGFFGS